MTTEKITAAKLLCIPLVVGKFCADVIFKHNCNVPICKGSVCTRKPFRFIWIWILVFSFLKNVLLLMFNCCCSRPLSLRLQSFLPQPPPTIHFWISQWNLLDFSVIFLEFWMIFFLEFLGDFFWISWWFFWFVTAVAPIFSSQTSSNNSFSFLQTKTQPTPHSF